MKAKPIGASDYFNRELSWLAFNRRVLEQAANASNPALERLRFLAIFESNLDEFFMVRVSGLMEQDEAGVSSPSPDGRTPKEQLHEIRQAAAELRTRAAQVYAERIAPALEAAGVRIRSVEDVGPARRRELDRRFAVEIFPLLTPLLLHPAPSVPFISNRSLNLAVELEDDHAEGRLARVKIPDSLPRAMRLAARRHDYILLEDLIRRNLSALFPGVRVRGAYLFRVLRDADVEIRELEAADLIQAIEETLRLRRFGDPVLLIHGPEMPMGVRDRLLSLHDLGPEDALETPGILGMEVFDELARIEKPGLRFPSHKPYLDEAIAKADDLFETIRHHDLAIHHPYDSFRPVEAFVASAANDPAVAGIKQTLYRVGSESPIVESLLEAAAEGKQVAAMVELKARFDESNNIIWARQLERAGAHVTFGFAQTKTHCKLALIVRREARDGRPGVRTYAHVGTGNYNPATARGYTDLGLFTADPEICLDISELFNYLTGFSRQTNYRKLLVAPINLREGMLARIRRETAHRREGRPAEIFWKLNSLVDPEVIDALYEASAAGVRCRLIVRGSCCLRPGVPGLSETISVVSLVGRFLEHSRVYWFANGGESDVLIGSADAMRRNFDRRIEVLCPVEDPRLRTLMKEHVLEPCWRDDVRAWELRPDGEYRRRKSSATPFDAQEWLIRHPLSRECLAARPQGVELEKAEPSASRRA